MEKQMRAERERREQILIAEGQKTSLILVAEGKKSSAILDAEGEKESMILRAEAIRNTLVLEAEGEAAAIKLIKEAGADKNVLALRGMVALEKVANGQATKIIVPSNLQDLVSFGTLFHESKTTIEG